MEAQIPVPVRDFPHWRVNYRPNQFVPEKIKSIKELYNLVEKSKVSFRGWDFPHLSNRNNEREVGSNWIASWSDFRGNLEYWRLYQSGQFIHLSTVEEDRLADWRQQLDGRFRSLFHNWDVRNIGNISGFISINNFIYTMTEIFEFAARLCSASVYEGTVSVKIELKKVRNFALVPEQGRHLMNLYKSTQEEIGFSMDLAPEKLIANAADLAIESTSWFFERFQWFNPPLGVLKEDQRKLITGTY